MNKVILRPEEEWISDSSPEDCFENNQGFRYNFE